MRYLVVLTHIWAAVALGWRWSFTVCKPGLGIVTRVGVGGLKGGGKGGAEEKQTQGGRGGGEGGGRGRGRGRGVGGGGATKCVV